MTVWNLYFPQSSNCGTATSGLTISQAEMRWENDRGCKDYERTGNGFHVDIIDLFEESNLSIATISSNVVLSSCSTLLMALLTHPPGCLLLSAAELQTCGYNTRSNKIGQLYCIDGVLVSSWHVRILIKNCFALTVLKTPNSYGTGTREITDKNYHEQWSGSTPPVHANLI